MLNLQAIEEQLAKGDPKLTAIYTRLKEAKEKELAKMNAKKFDQEVRIEVPEDQVEEVLAAIDEAQEPGEVVSQDAFTCSKCSKVCASNAGRAAHERTCKK